MINLYFIDPFALIHVNLTSTHEPYILYTPY